MVESRCGAVAVGQTYLLPPLSCGGALVVQPCLRFHIPLIEPGHADLPHPALGQDFTPSPTARRAQAGTGVRARSARTGGRVDRSRALGLPSHEDTASTGRNAGGGGAWAALTIGAVAPGPEALVAGASAVISVGACPSAGAA